MTRLLRTLLFLTILPGMICPAGTAVILCPECIGQQMRTEEEAVPLRIEEEAACSCCAPSTPELPPHPAGEMGAPERPEPCPCWCGRGCSMTWPDTGEREFTPSGWAPLDLDDPVTLPALPLPQLRRSLVVAAIRPARAPPPIGLARALAPLRI